MCLLTFSFYMLTQHPDIEHRLRQEIFEKVGPTVSPTYEHMGEMKYTRAFLNGMEYYVFSTLQLTESPSRGSQALPAGVSFHCRLSNRFLRSRPFVIAPSIHGPTTSLLSCLL